MSRTKSYAPWTLERRVDLLLPRRADADVLGKKAAGVRHGGLCSLVGSGEGGSPAAAGAVDEEGFRGLMAGGKKVERDRRGSTKGIAERESSHTPLAVNPEAFLPATVKNRPGSLIPATFRPTATIAPPRKRTSAPYDLATRLVKSNRWENKTKVCRQIVPESDTKFFAAGASFLPIEHGGSFLQKKLIDARGTVEERLREFRHLTAKLHRQNKRKPDMEAFKILKASGRTPGEKYLGEVPGVEVGDEFYYRTELMVAGVHGSPIAGIDSAALGGEKVATCVVSHKFKGYVNLMTDGDDVLVYSGQGGNPLFESTRKGSPTDQRLERGNLALRNSMVAGTPVRVVHGGVRVDDGDPAAAETSSSVKYIYDGLYVVEKFWPEMGTMGFTVLKFQMRRLPGQRKLELRQVLRARAAGSKQVLTARTARQVLRARATAARRCCCCLAAAGGSAAAVALPWSRCVCVRRRLLRRPAAVRRRPAVEWSHACLIYSLSLPGELGTGAAVLPRCPPLPQPRRPSSTCRGAAASASVAAVLPPRSAAPGGGGAAVEELAVA